MKHLLIIALLVNLFFSQMQAQVESFVQAQSASSTSGKLILLEFVHEGCEYCEIAATQQEQSETVKSSLQQVVHLILDVNVGEGIDLSEKYNVGIYYPVFVLTNQGGEEIYRWTGYSNDEKSFINTLKVALSDRITVKERIELEKENPTIRGTLFLAKYYSDTGAKLKAVEYYRRAQTINPRFNYRPQIFKNMAEAAWEDKIIFDAVLPPADSVLNFKRSSPDNIIEVATLMTRLARVKGETDQIRKYLQAGLDATKANQSKQMIDTRNGFMADFALHVQGDTIRAIRIKKASMIKGWENDRDTFYKFSKWCLERKINLAEAELHARKAITLVYPGKYRGMVLNTVAEICSARGNTEEAIKIIKLAIDEEPDNDFYVDQLEKFLLVLRRESQD